MKFLLRSICSNCSIAMLLLMAGCSAEHEVVEVATIESVEHIENIEIAEEISMDSEWPSLDLYKAEIFIDAFYSFQPEALQALLTEADESAEAILYYQGWANGGNYKVIERKPCIPLADGRIECAITVEDDPVLALNTGFHVTDTFTLSFDSGSIVSIETSSNDQPIYYEARAWVEENMPEVMTGPCLARSEGGNTPADCARAMTEGYARFYAAEIAE